MKKVILAISIMLSGFSLQARDHVLHNNLYGLIRADRSYCSAEVCNYNINWRSRYGQSTVVVLEVQGGPESGARKLFACSGSSGYQSADWIRRDGARYIFRLFETDRCSVDAAYYASESDRVVVQEYGGSDGGDYPGYKYGDINAYRSQCYSDLCTYNIEWRVGSNASVVTVVDPETRQEKLMSCSGRTGNASPNWIKRNGMRYEFRLYDSSRCSADLGRFERPVDTITVRER